MTLAAPADLKADLLAQLREIRDLPTLPTVFVRIMRALGNPNASVKEISKIVEADQAMTMKILRLINSSFYGLSRSVDSVHQAIVLLGANTLKNVVISASVFKALGSSGSGKDFNREAFWQHSIGCGMIARYLGKRTNCSQDEEGFIAGIIHDIGKVVLDHYFHDYLVEITQKISQSNLSFYQAERETLGLSHTEIGAFLAETWSLPPKLVRVIAEHHQFNPASDQATLVALIQISDMIVRRLKVGSGGDDLIPVVPPEAWQQIKLSPEMLDALSADLQLEVEKSQDLLVMMMK